jgi:hypothetical protein
MQAFFSGEQDFFKDTKIYISTEIELRQYFGGQIKNIESACGKKEDTLKNMEK